MTGLNDAGKPVVVHAPYDALPAYPQSLDDAMPVRWAAHQQIPARALSLHIEGGNLWSDGAGTLIMSSAFQRHDRSLTVDAVTEQLRAMFKFEKLIVTPHLDEEETGHVDIFCPFRGHPRGPSSHRWYWIAILYRQ